MAPPILPHRRTTEAYKHSEAAQKYADKLRREINSEIQALGNHPWAGVYYQGDGLGENVTLMLAPSSGCLFEWHGCLGLYDRNYGRVKWDGEQIHLSLKLLNEREGLGGIAQDLVPVNWDGRRYLIPSDDLVGFCNEVNDGSEPRRGPHGLHLLWDGDEEIEVQGLPEVPEEYQPYQLSQPIEAEIIGASSGKSEEMSVTLNCGSRAGLLQGMRLHVVEPEDSFESFEVVEVDEDQARAVVMYPDEDDPRPQVGWRVSTRHRSHLVF